MHPRVRYAGKRNRTGTKSAVGEWMPTVRMSVEEYLDLVERAAQGGKQVIRGARKVRGAVRKARSGKKDPKMASALRKANAWGRTKSGKLRKGITQGKIMKKAHQLRRKM